MSTALVAVVVGPLLVAVLLAVRAMRRADARDAALMAARCAAIARRMDAANARARAEHEGRAP